MDKKKKRLFLVLWLCAIVLLLVGSLLVPAKEHEETIREAMRDAVLHESNKINLPGVGPVNPGLISAVTVTAVLLAAALLIRIFAIPRFKYVPGRLQLLLEQGVSLFDNLAKSNSPWRNGFLGAYLFGAGCYVFFGTLFELFGIQAITPTARPLPCRRRCLTSTQPLCWACFLTLSSAPEPLRGTASTGLEAL